MKRSLTSSSPVATPDRSAELADANLQPVEQDWPYLLSLLPAGWDSLAFSTGAIQRKREIDDPAVFLRLILAYAFCGLSLRLTVFWAEVKGFAAFSQVALYKRLRKARPWLAQLVAAKLTERRQLARPPATDLRVRLLDATVASRPGSKGTDWRIHLTFDLQTLTIAQVEVTSAKGGETLKRFPAQPREITVADRGYSQRQGLAALTAEGGWALIRVNWGALPLQQLDGAEFDLWAALRDLPDGQRGTWAVRTAPAKDGTPPVAGRLIALRKSPEAGAETRRKLLKEARKKGKTPSQEALAAADYVLLFTTVPEEQLTPEAALELYRFRWQIELTFKRLKTLLHLDELPAKDPELAQTYLLGKLLAALLIEDLTAGWVDFSPWGYGPAASPFALASVSNGGADTP
jgi:hypothetical protein